MMESELVPGRKYIFFARKYLETKESFKYLNKDDMLRNRHIETYSIEGNNIADEKWDFPQSKAYKEVSKLKIFIKLLEKTNETDKFFDIDFK